MKTSTTLDQFWENEGKPEVRLVKIDVEGSEWDVLKGATTFLRTAQPMLLMELVERWLARFGKTRRDCAELLQDCGYRSVRAVGAPAFQSLSTFQWSTDSHNFVLRVD